MSQGTKIENFYESTHMRHRSSSSLKLPKKGKNFEYKFGDRIHFLNLRFV